MGRIVRASGSSIRGQVEILKKRGDKIIDYRKLNNITISLKNVIARVLFSGIPGVDTDPSRVILFSVNRIDLANAADTTVCDLTTGDTLCGTKYLPADPSNDKFLITDDYKSLTLATADSTSAEIRFGIILPMNYAVIPEGSETAQTTFTFNVLGLKAAIDDASTTKYIAVAIPASPITKEESDVLAVVWKITIS